jgi:hypothetical protein
MSFLQQHGKRLKEIQVGSTYMLVAHDQDYNNALDKCTAGRQSLLANYSGGKEMNQKTDMS